MARCLAVFLLSLLTLAAGFAPAHAASPGDTLDLGAVDFKRQWDKAEHSDAEVYRMSIAWKTLTHKVDMHFSTPRLCDDPPFNFCGPDREILDAANAGMKTHVVLINPPVERTQCSQEVPFVRDGQNVMACPPAMTEENRAAWKNYVGHTVNRYGPNGYFWEEKDMSPHFDVVGWEVWNEPNLTGFWGGLNSEVPVETRVNQYAALVNDTEAALDYVTGEEAKVVGPAVFVPNIDLRWIEEFATRAAALKLDRISHHPYDAGYQAVLQDISYIRATLPNRPMWVTELGFGSCGTEINNNVDGNQAQRDHFVALLQNLPAYVVRLVWFNGRDNADCGPSSYAQMGLYRGGTGTPEELTNPVGGAFKNWAER